MITRLIFIYSLFTLPRSTHVCWSPRVAYVNTIWIVQESEREFSQSSAILRFFQSLDNPQNSFNASYVVARGCVNAIGKLPPE